MKIVFMGTGEISLPSFKWLLQASNCDVVGTFTQPDKPIGRKQVITKPEVKVLAENEAIPVWQPTSFKKQPETIDQLEQLDCDIIVVMAYGQLLPKRVINAANIACVNLHASLLPRHRGASPIQAAIRDGDTESGITLMHIAAKLDAGDMILKSTLKITADETGGSLHDRLAELGPELLEKGLPKLIDGSAEREPQDDELVTYSGKLGREDGVIDWQNSATDIEKLIRAYHPWPGTSTTLPGSKKNRKMKLFPGGDIASGDDQTPGTILDVEDGLKVQCGENTALCLNGDLQLEGKKRMPIRDFLKGASLERGTILG